MKKLLAMICLLLLSGMTNAGEATGRVTSIYVADDSRAVLFQLDSSIKDTPKCNESARFSLSLRKKGGMAVYMALLEAKRENIPSRLKV